MQGLWLSNQYVKNPIFREYPTEVKQLCLKMYLNGMGFRAIARVTEINHTTIINWVKEAGKSLSDEVQQLDWVSWGNPSTPLVQDEEIPEITEIDELYAERYPLGQTFVGNKRNKLWIWTVVNHKPKGILLWSIGDWLCQCAERNRSHETFEPIWQIIKCWRSFS